MKVFFPCFLDRDQYQLGTLSHYLNQRCAGYHEIPEFPEVAPDPTVRHVESSSTPQPSSGKRSLLSPANSSFDDGRPNVDRHDGKALQQQPAKLKRLKPEKFYSDEESEEEEEDEEEEEEEEENEAEEVEESSEEAEENEDEEEEEEEGEEIANRLLICICPFFPIRLKFWRFLEESDEEEEEEDEEEESEEEEADIPVKKPTAPQQPTKAKKQSKESPAVPSAAAATKAKATDLLLDFDGE